MTSVAPFVPSTKEATNYERLCRLLVDVGSQVVRETFDRVRPPGSLHTVLADPAVHAKLQSLRKKRVLSTPQWRKLYPVIKSSVSSRDFDPTLLVILLRNICSLVPPATGWDNLPLLTDTTLEADIARIKFYRDTIYHSHGSDASLDDVLFSVYWKEIKDTLVRLGGAYYRDAIDVFENETMDPDFEEHYQELLKQWVEDEESIKDKLDEDERRNKLSKLDDLEESNVNSERETGMKETKSLECPPRLNIKIPTMSDLPNTSYPWNIVDLPINILIMTVEDCEFLSCFFYLDKPFKSYHKDIGYVYFGSVGSDHGKKRKIALMKCSKGSADPGSSLSVVKDAVRVLRPRAVFSVGACSGLNPGKTKLGDVVVSSKLITPSYKTPPGRDIGNLIKHIADGWTAPLENPDEQEVRVHCDGVVLSIQKDDSGGWQYEEIMQRYPEATAVEMEGRGVFAAAHDLKTEWVVVKGIKDYADGSHSPNDQTGAFACVMAASVVANILSDPVIFEEWPHYNPDANGSFMPAVSAYTKALKASIKSQTEFQPKLMASPTISNPRTDDIFTNLLIQHGRKTLYKKDATSTRQEWLNYYDMTLARGELLDYYDVTLARGELLDYYGQVSGTRVKSCEEIFVCGTEGEPNPKSILVTGKAGIGKSLFSQKLVRDWADDKLFQSQANLKTPDIKFAYLLTFRQLNLLGNDRFSLRELLNCSSTLDENSNLDNSLFEYLVNHPEEVLIILDGYDEYSLRDYIASSSEEQYPNNASEEMPVAALCAKLIKGKMMRESVVMITSRPDESDKMGGIHFDRYVEITGFSPEQVEEYIVKYFKENETMKNSVLEHVMNNDNLVSFAHIPVLCFLMCFYLEYTLRESKSTDLPVSATEIYSDVVNIFELKHNAESEYKTKGIPEKHKVSDVIESTLDKLSELAAQLLLQQRPIFDERDMKENFKLEEIEKLKGSGLLHCGPPFRKSAFETTKQLSFTHLTIQEFLAARWFVMRNEIPKETVSEMVMLFIAGILSKKKDDKLMERLLESISITTKPVRVRAKLLSEYQDKDFAKNVIINHPQHYSDMNFTNLNDVGCIAISFLLDVISELNEEEAATAQHERSKQSFNVNSLAIIESALTLSGIKRICKSLEKEHCAVTELLLWMAFNHFSDTVIIRLCEALQHSSCKVTTLNLIGNQITDTGVPRLCEALQHPSCKVTTLNLSYNPITDTGVASLCEALQHPSCNVTTLNLIGNQITDTGVASLCEALQHPSCKVTTLNLSYNPITDTGVPRLCEALQHPSCKVTTLNLSYNPITDTGVASLCEALQHPSCNVTTLNLSGNQITDTGVTRLREALQHPSCKVTTLNLSGNQITDTGVTRLCEALQHPSCNVTTLHLSKNQITDTGVANLCEALQHPSCKVTTLELNYNQITDTDVAKLCAALQHSSCKVTTLNLGCNQITDTGVAILCEALKLSNCKLISLRLWGNHISEESKKSLSTLVQQHRPGFKLDI
ncbi:hypothetical protein ACROYT_G029122 [Oculina patagonica]